MQREGRREDGLCGGRAKCLGVGGSDFDTIAAHHERVARLRRGGVRWVAIQVRADDA